MSPAIEVTRAVNSDKMDERRNRDTMWVELLDTEVQPGSGAKESWLGCVWGLGGHGVG